ncbi:MAG: S8 family peptidase [Gemmataceae bacterium]
MPPRERQQHGASLVNQLQQATDEARAGQGQNAQDHLSTGVNLVFRSEPDFELAVKSLEAQAHGIELVNVREDQGAVFATVFIPYGKVAYFSRKFQKYLAEDDKRSGRPKNQRLVESISQIKRAVFESFWTDASEALPQAGEQIWWEVWLRTGRVADLSLNVFRVEAARVGMPVGPRHITFPDRAVVVAFGTQGQMAQSVELLDVVAELRRAKECPTTFINMTPREQTAWAAAAKERVVPPAPDANSVCVLDTGVNAGQPLLSPALSSDHVLTSVGGNAADHDGHGTGMAGLALYGSLAEVLTGDGPISLRHRLESVKILPPPNAEPTRPDLYGAVTLEAVAHIESVCPERNRVFCMAVTATDSRDRGQPSSWSAELDKICFGEDEAEPRLVFVSAGNTTSELRHQYPDSNYTDGIHDPGQAWNATTVGACTERVSIESSDFVGWTPVAPSGGLSPCSTTSLVWNDKWPLKPDIVLEGGNSAINPADGTSDTIEDLCLLTTSRDASGRLFVGTGDTSAATALASRMGAIIQAEYPDYRLETVRALLVHSAEWTPKMGEEFPKNKQGCHRRLRCYGYGVPSLTRALWCARNALTLIAEAELQPFDKEGDRVKTRDMHLYSLPWPIDELRGLGETPVTMRVTLSYFVEPSPGRKGWANRHRYASHGLRFDVKRPEESPAVFLKRLNQQAREEDEGGSFGSDTREWTLGDRLRTRGSVHSDWWTGTAAQLADCGTIGVVPVIGWWRERPHFERWTRKARYSLVVSVHAPGVNVDLYTPVFNLVAVKTETEIETE